MAFLLSPNPGAFTAATFNTPLNLLTTRVAKASFSISSAIMTSGLPVLAICSKTGLNPALRQFFYQSEGYMVHLKQPPFSLCLLRSKVRYSLYQSASPQ